MKATTLFTAGVFIVLAGFVMKAEKDPTQSLYETKWSLKKIHTAVGTEEVNTKAFIKFHELKKSAGGNGSCNNFGSDFKREGKMISFSNIFSTKMYCDGVQQTEDAFFRQLAKVNRFEIKDKKLILYSDKDPLLEFVAE